MAERQVTIRVRADGSNIVQTFRLMGAEGERALGQIRTAANSQKQSFDTLGRSMAQTRTQSTAFNGGLRGVALQLSQVGQQTIATGDFVKSLAIQLPDLALGFGAVGIAAGVVAGAVLPLVANALFDTEEKGGELKDRMTELGAATKQYQAAVERLRSPLADLREEFGQNAEAMRGFLKVQAEAAQINALTALLQSRESITGQFGDISRASRDAARNIDALIAEKERLEKEILRPAPGTPVAQIDQAFVRLDEVRSQLFGVLQPIQRITEELGVSNAEAGELLANFLELNAAQGPQQQLEAVGRLRDLYFEAAKANGELSAEENATLDALFNLEESLLRVIAGTDQVAESARGGAENVASMANEMSRAANEALRFVSNLGSASLAGVRAEVAALEGGGSRTDARVARREAEIRSSDEFKTALQGPEGLRQSALQGLQREIELTREAAALDERRASALKEMNDIGKGGSGGGAGRSLKELNEAARQTESIINQARQAAVGYADVVALLDEALRSGKISQDDYNRALDLAKERFDKVGEGAKQARDDFKEFAKSALTDIDGLGDALDQLGSRLLSRGFDTLFDSIFPSGGGGKGLLGLGGFLGFLDGGGPIKAGEFAVVGERRPEIVTGPANVIGGAETARLMRGGGGGSIGGQATIRLIAPEGFSVAQEGKVAGIALQVTQAGIEQFTRSTLPQAVDRINRDPRRRG
ncbi:hypothetical protein KZZ08_02335 [Roseovarius mucosus]|uniref:hypothetical protein n=1 Tax=Roseovarius mucosus TaxID=215743 RepID=UPI001C5FD078|nr:hypothetical protein [Roseovarius mucosus]MBW4972435.1 hypothetical protein [Roseovarius mucosus]